MPVTRFLNDGSTNYDLAYQQRLTAALLMELRAETMFVPGAMGAPNALPIVATKTINQGYSHRWDWLGLDYSVEDHTPGDEMSGQAYTFHDASVTVDPYFIKAFEVAVEDKNISSFNPDPGLIKGIATGIAEELDQRCVLTAISAARTAAVTKNGLTIHPGGNVVTRTGSTGVSTVYSDDSTGSGRIDDDVAALAYALDVDGVSDQGRYLVLTPWIRRIMRHEPSLFDRDYSAPTNDMNARIIGRWHGFQVLERTYKRMPTTLDTSRLSKYQVDCSFSGTGEPVALAFCGAATGQAAVAYVQAASVRGYTEKDERTNVWFMKGEVMGGFGALHPQCAGLIQAQNG